MSSRRYQRVHAPPVESDRLWPLDLALIATAGLIIYLIYNYLYFDDPRWLYNAKTYIIAVPVITVLISFAFRKIASQFVQRSAQVGFLFSVFLHLLLLILAINVVIFNTYLPQASEKSKKKKRTPARSTVPEHLFQAPRETIQTPDWSKPVHSQTTSRVIPREQRQLPPVQRSEPRLEMPKQRETEPQRPMKKMLMKREEFTPAKPMPADAPGKLARRETQNNDPKPVNRSIDIPSPSPKAAQQAKQSPSERNISQDQPRTASSQRAPSRPQMTQLSPSLSPQPLERTPSIAALSRTREMPTIGESGVRQQQRQRPRQNRARPAGAAPTTPTVAVAKESPNAMRAIARSVSPMSRDGRASGAQMATGDNPSFSANTSQQTSPGSVDFSRNNTTASMGAPSVEAGNARRAPGRSRSANRGAGFSPVGMPTATDAMAASESSTGTSGTGTADQVADRMGIMDVMRNENASGQSGADSPSLADAGGAGMALDVMAEVGPVGLADIMSSSPGVTMSDEQPEIATLDLSRDGRARREVGGPTTPAGSKVAAVESFSRRVMRTHGGAAPEVAGFAGPATEEAIELGLQYLANTQNKDGSWSLQGHGNNVALRSDTAATGLCLLAFQGAGYTHLQHQYADTVSRGLKFLINNQRTNGNLYRPERHSSDENVAFYSHGIAALAMSEAYGMTQDRELRGPAQLALKYIMATQHRQRGGWRYIPQVSSDTSVTGWMMMALKSGELAGLEVKEKTYDGINTWLELSKQNSERADRYRYNPFAPDTDKQRHGRKPTPTMTAVGMLMRMYSGWRRDNKDMQSAADYLLRSKPQLGTAEQPKRDGYYWYYATQVMFHMGGDYWEQWNRNLNPLLLSGQVKDGPRAGSWDPRLPIPDRWSPHAGRLYVTTMNLLNLEVYYRHLPIYEETAE